MRRRMLFLAVTLALLSTVLTQPTVPAGSCEGCAENCNSIPMATEDCLQLYCPECAGSS